MKKIITIAVFFHLLTLHAQEDQAFQDGEWFQFRIHYGMFNASFATLEVDETTFKNRPVYHITGKGKSTGLLHLFFKVDDNYETYMDRESGVPYRFIRKIDEGGHVKDIQINFDHENNSARVIDFEHNKTSTHKVENNAHDMLSAFYYLRNNLNVEDLEKGEMVHLNMFFDKENHDFQLKFLGREVINTKLGKIATLKFRPFVMAGRVFKEKESLTVWISDDANKMPVKIEADLAVGSLEADINAFKGLKHPLRIIMD